MCGNRIIRMSSTIDFRVDGRRKKFCGFTTGTENQTGFEFADCIHNHAKNRLHLRGGGAASISAHRGGLVLAVVGRVVHAHDAEHADAAGAGGVRARGPGVLEGAAEVGA
eukprot:1993380-Rhodomonas_salina.1